MKCGSARENDGTIAITSQVAQPMQGTWISEGEEGIVLAKGVVRPPLRHGDVVEEEVVLGDAAAFGRTIDSAPVGNFHRVKEVGRERCGLAYQTLLFSTTNPAGIIREDTKRISKMSALDLLGKEGKEKVLHGVPASMLVQSMSPWDMLRKYEARGIRATVYGSELVVAGNRTKSAMAAKLQDAGLNLPWHSRFMLLPGSADALSHAAGKPIGELVGRLFLVHRDPALPDGTSMFRAIFQGVCDWKDGGGKHGVVLHPSDPNWSNAGGDYDGDAASVYLFGQGVDATCPVIRPSYRIGKPIYASKVVREQILQAAESTVTGLLGPIILSAMRLKERRLDTQGVLALTAGLAQASVEAKKHAVDEEQVTIGADRVFGWVREGSYDGMRPYVSDFTNALYNASGLDAKLDAWSDLMQAVSSGLWDNGTDIERAMVERIHVIDRLAMEVDYFQRRDDRRLPRSIIESARSFVDSKTEIAVRAVTEEYRRLVADMYTDNGVEEAQDDDFLSSYSRDQIRRITQQFKYFCATGVLGKHRTDQHTAQCALVGYGPHSIAARFVPAEIFKELGTAHKKIVLAVMDGGWEDGEYPIEGIRPIPSCVRDFNAFAKGLERCFLEVVYFTGKCTRVVLTGAS